MINNEKERTCKICGKTLPIDMFYKRRDRSRIDGHWVEGYYNKCKYCLSQYHTQWINDHPSYSREYSKQYRELNKICINCSGEFKTNFTKDMFCKKEDCLVAKGKYKKEQNRIKYNPKKILYVKKRMENDIDYKLKIRLRNKISSIISNKKQYTHTTDLLGCSIFDIRQHLERQFKDGMTWDNYGKWHIDHIIPISYFDFTKEEDQKRCFHYTNLQPLWAKENIRKSNKIIEVQLILL